MISKALSHPPQDHRQRAEVQNEGAVRKIEGIRQADFKAHLQAQSERRRKEVLDSSRKTFLESVEQTFQRDPAR